MFRLLALDLDGTLLNSALRLSDTNAEAVREAMARGVQVVLATARFYGIALRTAVRLETQTPLICSNGALVKRPTDGTELLHLQLDHDLAREVTTLGDDSGWEMFTTIGDSTYMQMRPGIIPERLPGGLKIAERQSDHIDEGPATCVLVFGEDAVNEISSRFLAAYEGRAGFSINRPTNSPHYVILTHPQAHKARALEVVLNDLGVAPEETIAMGDSESDIGMFRLSGLGIAMRNSPDEVKREALHVAPSNDEDGVAWAIRKFLL
ncbi:MAG TPA: Cof-type HAD-IIB family hydrolase [Dehalococcoidia bacterium]|nr:Cof-type HAD-IIB family hydrolase [Dehalococcoidia bacterium]